MTKSVEELVELGRRCQWRTPDEVPFIRNPILVQWKGDMYDVLNMGILWPEAWTVIGKKILRWKYVE